MKRHLNTLLLILLGISLLALAGHRHTRLLHLRQTLHLNEAPPLENMKPGTAVAVVALGAFRGIIADILWIRATRMQEEGQYFELVQLADWITKLEPRFPQVWAFQAWNMAYNISVLFNTPEDRWRWVRHGIELLRDQALQHNPSSATLHWELGWLFQHKMGQNLDQMHWHYKTQWYNSINTLLNGPAPNYYTWNDATTPDHPLYKKRQTLEQTYKIDLSIMEEIDLIYGPLDWRTPNAHAIYWAFRGIQRAHGQEPIRLRRMLFQSLAQAFRYGTYYPNKNAPYYTPNLAMLDNALQAYQDGLSKEPDNPTYKTAHKNFLSEAIIILNLYGQPQRAKNLYHDLQTLYPDTFNNRDFDDFIIYLAAREDLQSLNLSDATAFIEGLLMQSLIWESLDQPQLANGQATQAKHIYTKYMAAKNTSPEFKQRLGLPPFQDLLNRARQRALNNIQQGRPPQQNL